MKGDRRQLSPEDGFTVVELLAAMVVGLVVLMAAFMLLDRATEASNRLADRQDAVQRGRQALELMTRQLRSQVCLGDTVEPITYGDGDRVRFYADLSDGSRNVQLRELRYAPAAQTIAEDVWTGVGTYPSLTFGGAPATRTLLTKVARMTEDGTTRPIFRYFAFRVGGVPGDMEELPVPLSPDDASRTVMIKVALFAKPDRFVPKDRDSTSLQSDIYVRIADPSRPTEGPRCL